MTTSVEAMAAWKWQVSRRPKGLERRFVYVERASMRSRCSFRALCAIAGWGRSVARKDEVLRTPHPKVASRRRRNCFARSPTDRHRKSMRQPLVAPLARISPGVSIGPYVVIGEDAHVGQARKSARTPWTERGCWVGENCRIHPRVTLYAGMRVGHRVEFNSGAVIGADGMWLRAGEGKYWKISASRNRGDWWRRRNRGEHPRSTAARSTITRIAEGVKLDNWSTLATTARLAVAHRWLPRRADCPVLAPLASTSSWRASRFRRALQIGR